MVGKFQFIWWGFHVLYPPIFQNVSHLYNGIIKYSVAFGPIEIRVWNTEHPTWLAKKESES